MANRIKYFDWKSLIRVIKATVLDPVHTLEDLQDFLFLALFVVVATRRQVLAVRNLLDDDRRHMEGAYILVQEMISNLMDLVEIFPQNRRHQIEEFLKTFIGEVFTEGSAPEMGTMEVIKSGKN